MSTLNILILDDEKRIREELNDFLTDNEFVVLEAATPSEAFKIIDSSPIDIAIIDLNLPEKDGLTVLKEIKAINSEIEILIITGQGDMEKAITAMRLGAADFFNKPIRLNEVLQAIERSKRYINLSRQFNNVSQNYDRLLQEMQENMGLQIIGISKSIQKVMQDITIASEYPDLSVLVSGESGTGKELVARSIHYLSSRKSNYFYAVNCAAIPDTLFESEFFGYDKGAFTGAISHKPGWFEIANNGTLFLDEIGDMQALMQAKLLRITEDSKVRRLGSNREIPVNVRIITATNRDIEQLVASGDFRRDLLHRINTFEIKIPPLRERPEDIPILSEHYIRYFAAKTGKSITGIESALMDKLIAYPYPGNVRELKNMLERAIILCHNSKLTFKHFNTDAFSQESISIENNSLDQLYDLEQIEKETIIKALAKTKNNYLQAAKLLNITWQTLQRRLDKHKLS